MLRRNGLPGWARWAIAAAAGLVVAGAVCLARNIFQAEGAARVLRILCDATFLAAVLLIGVGLMTFVSSQGMFDILTYGTIRFFSLFKIDTKRENTLPGGEHGEGKKNDFFAYKQSKAGARSPQWYLVWVGLGYLALTFLFLALFHQTGGIPMA